MRPGLSCGGGGCLGGAARMFAIAAGGMLGAVRGPFVTVSDVWTGPRGRAVSSGSLILRLVGFGWGCAGVRPTRVPMVVAGLHLCAVSPVLCCCGRRCSGRSARSRGLSVACATSLHISRLNVLFVGRG